MWGDNKCKHCGCAKTMGFDFSFHCINIPECWDYQALNDMEW